MGRKWNIGIIGAALLMIAGKVILDNPDDTIKAVGDATEIVSSSGEAVKNETIGMVDGMGNPISTTIYVPPVAGG